MSVESLFKECAAATLREHLGRIEVCLGKLTPDQIWARGHESENAVGNLALHLQGNVGQWVISGLGEVPDTRFRDAEFSARGGYAAEELMQKLRATVVTATEIILALEEEQLTLTHQIQGNRISGVYAVLHVVEHFAQHTAQIIYATKMLTGEGLGFYCHLDPKR